MFLVTQQTLLFCECFFVRSSPIVSSLTACKNRKRAQNLSQVGAIEK